MSAIRRTPQPATPIPTPAPERVKLPGLDELKGIFSQYFMRHFHAALSCLGQMRQRPLITVLIVMVIGIALALPAGLFVLLKNAETVMGQADEKAPISLFLKMPVSDSQAGELVKQLSGHPDIAKVEYISAAQGLAEFQKQSALGGVLNGIKENPLPGLIRVTPRSEADLGYLDNLAQAFKAIPEVELVQYDQDWVTHFNALLDLGRHLIYGLAILLALGILFIIGATIHIATEQHHEEILVYQLVGANSAFIRRPFLYTGIGFGLGGACVAWLILIIFLAWTQGAFNQLMQVYNSSVTLIGLGVGGSLLLLLLGAGLGWLGSWVAVYRHLTMRLNIT